MHSDMLPGRGETFSSLNPISEDPASLTENGLNDVSQVMSGMLSSEVRNVPQQNVSHQPQRATRLLENDIYGKLILLGFV